MVSRPPPVPGHPRRNIILPAAGDSVRFGGLPKELLPMTGEHCLLTYNVFMALALGGTPVIITNPHKEYWHRKALERAEIDEAWVEFRVRKDYRHKDMWGSFERGLDPGVAGGLLLPDTMIPFDDPAKLPHPGRVLMRGDYCQLAFGLFETATPERFSIVTPHGICTKQKEAPGNLAWGMILWEAEATDFLLAQEVDHYDRALERAMLALPWDTFRLPAFYDLGTFPDYYGFLLDCPKSL